MMFHFLSGKQWDLQEAFEMWKRWRAFSLLYDVSNLKLPDVWKLYATGVAYYFGANKQGWPTLIIRPRLRTAHQFDVQETIRFGVWVTEEGIRRARCNGVDRISVIYDREGITLANFDRNLLSAVRSIASILQECYADRLGVFYILRVNWLYWMILKLVSPLLSAQTKAKLVILNDPSELLPHFESNQLQQMYGGTATFDFTTWIATQQPPSH